MGGEVGEACERERVGGVRVAERWIVGVVGDIFFLVWVECGRGPAY